MQSNVRQKILAGVSVSVSVLSSISAQEVTKEPNIIIIMADQLRVDLFTTGRISAEHDAFCR